MEMAWIPAWYIPVVTTELINLVLCLISDPDDPDPDPDSEKSFSEGAEMVEKPVESSSPESDDRNPSGKNETTPEPVSVETSAETPKPDEGANSDLNRATSAPKRSPSITKDGDLSLRPPESPRTPRTGVLGVGSKLLSRMRQTKR